MRHFIILTLLLALTACSNYRPQSAGFNDLLIKPYQLDAGDQLRIVVFDQPNITGTYTIDDSGFIVLPLIGKMPARGMSLDDLDQDITKKLAQDYLRNPDVSIEITNYRPFFIMGEITNAGQYDYVPGMTVQTAVAIAGGFTPRAQKNRAYLSRTLNGEILSSKVKFNAPLRPGDTVHIRERWF